jgi:S-DNA-T family DNA segregation ATPase FtsK/SpoIIIE
MAIEPSAAVARSDGDDGASPPPRARPKSPRIVDTSPAREGEKAEVVKVVPAFGHGFRLPATDMLEPPQGGRVVIDEQQLKAMAQLLEKTLADYGVSGKVEEIHPGPTVTTFEVSPAAGTKVSKVAGLADDLALGLSRKVRIVAPIPGKNRIGFEIPNEQRVPVSMRELVEDRRFVEMNAPLPCVLGRDIIGAPYFADLASMPHVIVAGATGAGKSVGLNVMLISLLFRRTPEDLRLLMIDPKVVELAPFDRIPHMLLPVVTDMKQAANALKWAVDEMERRYQLFANAGTKNITTYNAWVEKVRRGEARPPKPPAKVSAVSADGTEVLVDAAKDGSDTALPEKIPFIVIVVDEFADLMMQQGKDVEASVARLAQKARAAGMHVILATQRPSVDVITGMIKANFPTRIAFRVAQKVDSRTILDEQGAEHLLGRGDMLVKMNGSNETKRVQCPFCSEEEVQRITDFLRLQGEPVYDEAILKPRDEDGQEADTSEAEADPMYDAAVRIVADTRRCSTSWIQRKLGIGYNRAAKIVEAMEKQGLVGPANGAKDREVLISSI